MNSWWTSSSANLQLNVIGNLVFKKSSDLNNKKMIGNKPRFETESSSIVNVVQDCKNAYTPNYF